MVRYAVWWRSNEVAVRIARAHPAKKSALWIYGWHDCDIPVFG